MPSLRPLACLTALFLSAALTHATVGESDVFSFDSRDNVNTVVAETSAFTFDTRANDGLSASAASGVFAFGTNFASAPPLYLTGTVRDAEGLAIPSATVKLKRYETVFWQGSTNASGVFYASNLSPWDYRVAVSKAGYVDAGRSMGGAAGGNQTVSVTMTALGAAPATQDTTRVVAGSAIGACTPWDQNSVSASRLLVLNESGEWTISLSLLNPNLPTVVLAHGWKSNPTQSGNWPKMLAPVLQSLLGGAGAVNIVAWDWHTDAATPVIPPIDKAACQGMTLGYALMQSPLGSGYAQHIHFIGHSLGTIVNRFACDYVHRSLTGALAGSNPATGWSSVTTRPHVTLLDEAELASVGQTHVLVSAGVAGVLALASSGGDIITAAQAAVVQGSAQAKQDWKYPIPTNAHWVDNYISAVGFERAEAVNVCLPGGVSESVNPADWHSYAPKWYQWSAVVAGYGLAPPVGYRLSGEYAGMGAFPPSGLGMTKGSAWLENLGTTTDKLDLVRVTNAGTFACSLNLLANATVGVGQRAIVQPLDTVGRAVLNGYGTSVQFAGNKLGTVIYKTGQVASSVTQKVGLFLDAAIDQASDLANSIEPTSQMTLGGSGFSLLLTSGAAPAPLSANGLRGGTVSSDAPVTTPGAWVTMDVPANAGMLAFDFTVTGDPAEDMVVCAVNEQNLFTLPAKFATPGAAASTDLMDISAHEGQTVELFFGLVGGTSTNCTVKIDGIRFITIPEPKVGIADLGASFGVKWPAAATGWVLESSDTLAPGSWQTVTMPNGTTMADGVETLEVSKNGERRFYRLRRLP